MKHKRCRLFCSTIVVFLVTMAIAVSTGRTHALAAGSYIPGAMVPHKALYNIKMTSKKSSSQVINIRGEMFYEWRPVCDAWITDHKFNLSYEYADTPAMKIVSDFSTYESFDGKTFNFNSRRKRNDEIFQEILGTVELNDKHAGKATYKKPEGLSFDLKAGTLFPMTHTLTLLEKAKNKERFYNATVFDGSDEDGPVEINTFIGDEANPLASLPQDTDLDKSLIGSKAWNVRMAFFPIATALSDPEYEMNAVFHENGIISNMQIEYRDFSVAQNLIAIERLDAEVCPSP